MDYLIFHIFFFETMGKAKIEYTKDEIEKKKQDEKKRQTEFKALTQRGIPKLYGIYETVEERKGTGKLTDSWILEIVFRVVDLEKIIADVKEMNSKIKDSKNFIAVPDETDPLNPGLALPCLAKETFNVIDWPRTIHNGDTLKLQLPIKDIRLPPKIPGMYALIQGVFLKEGKDKGDGTKSTHMHASNFMSSSVDMKLIETLEAYKEDYVCPDSGEIKSKYLKDGVLKPLTNDSIANSLYYCILYAKYRTWNDTIGEQFEKGQPAYTYIPACNQLLKIEVNKVVETFSGSLEMIGSSPPSFKASNELLEYPKLMYSSFTIQKLMPGEKKDDKEAKKTKQIFVSGTMHIVEYANRSDGTTDKFVMDCEFIRSEQIDKSLIGKEGKPKSFGHSTIADYFSTNNRVISEGLWNAHRTDVCQISDFYIPKENAPSKDRDGTTIRWNAKFNSRLISNLPAYLDHCLWIISPEFASTYLEHILNNYDILMRDRRGIQVEKGTQFDLDGKIVTHTIQTDSVAKLFVCNMENPIEGNLLTEGVPNNAVRSFRTDIYLNDPSSEKNRNVNNVLNQMESPYKCIDEYMGNLKVFLKTNPNIEVGFLHCYMGPQISIDSIGKDSVLFSKSKSGICGPTIRQMIENNVKGLWKSEEEATAWNEIFLLETLYAWVNQNPLKNYQAEISEVAANFCENTWEKIVSIAKKANLEFPWSFTHIPCATLCNFAGYPYTRPKIQRKWGGATVVAEQVKEKIVTEKVKEVVKEVGELKRKDREEESQQPQKSKAF